MSKITHFLQVSTPLILLLLLTGTVGAQENNNSSSKPNSNDNRSSGASSYSRNPSSSQTRTSSSSYSRNPSSSQNNSSSSRNNYSRNSGPTSIERNRSSSGSSTIDRNSRISGSNSIDRNRGNGGTTSIDRNRGTSGATSIDRNRGNTDSNAVDRNRGQGQVDGDRDRNNRDNWQNSSGFNRDQRNPSTWSDPNRYNRDRNSNDHNRGHDSNDRIGDDSHRDYTHNKNSNYDRTRRIGGNSHNRYRIGLNRNNYSSNYYDRYFYDPIYSPYHNSLYGRSYYDRRYYSPSAFSTIILGAAVGLGGYNNYESGKSYSSSTGGYVELFEHAGFRGESLEVYAGEGVYNLKDIKIDHYKTFNDRFSSIKVFGEVTVVLYKDAELRGEYVYLTGSQIDFSRDRLLRRFNDEVSSIEVIPGVVEASTHSASAREYQTNDQLPNLPAYQQDPAGDPSNIPSSAKTTLPLDVRSSVDELKPLGSAPRVFLFDQPGFQGNQIVLSPGSAEVNLSRITKGLSGNWNDSIASIRVEGGAELFLYTDPEFLGDGIAISESVSNLSMDSGLISFVNSISSVVVNGAH